MFGSEILEVAIGVIFVFLLVSIIASAIREALEALLHTRGAYLERGIRELLHDTQAVEGGLTRAFFNHPLIFGLYAWPYEPRAQGNRPPMFVTGRRLPSYIPAKNFAVAIMDIAARGPITDAVSSDPEAPPFSLDSMRRNVTQLGNPAVQRVLLTAIDSSQGNLEEAQRAVQAWFDSGMDRVSGWYKRSTSWILFWVGLFVALGLNIDAIAISRFLYQNDAARAAIVASAEKATGDTAFLSHSYAQARTDLAALNLPIGRHWWCDAWPSVCGGPSEPSSPPAARGAGAPALVPTLSAPPPHWYEAIPGWLITAFAATVGAPFWFDILNKIMVIRSTVKPHEKSPEESSEDRQRPKPPAAARVAESAETAVVAMPGNAAAMAAAPSASGAVAASGAPQVRDATSSVDGCDVDMSTARSGGVVTTDEELPPAEGGVAA